MEAGYRKRIVGAVVILVMAALVLPTILDGSGRIPDRVTNIPPVIKKPDVSDIKPGIPQSSLLPAAVEVAKPSKKEEAVAPLDNQFVEDEKGAIKSWSVQVASFRDSKNADKLRQTLREAGFKAYADESVLSDGSIFTQILVGPEQDYQKIVKIKQDIKTDFNLSGLIYEFH